MPVTFEYLQPTDEQKLTMNRLRTAYKALYEEVKSNLPANRGASIALTKLEESAMWVNKSITENC